MDLEVLNLGSREKEILKKCGIPTVEALALSESKDLPFTRQKSENLVQTARSVIATQNVNQVDISENMAEIKCKNMDQIIQKSVMGVMNLEEYFNDVVVKGNNIITKPREGQEASWNAYVLPQLQRWEYRIRSLSNQTLKDKGITLSISEIKDFAQRNGFDGFWREVFGDIKGSETMKQAFAVSLFSTFDEPVHMAIIGPPASAKTLARDIIAENFTDIQTVGASVTRAGLVINYATGELGAISSANNMVVLADEFDKVPAKDTEFMYELMSSGTCPIHSGNIHTIIRSKFILIATMNPRDQVFSEDPIKDIELSPTLISRFALVVKTEELQKPERMDLLKEKFYSGSMLRRFSEHFDQWVKLSRIHNPKITAPENKVDQYILNIDKVIEELSSTPLRRDLRMGDAGRRIAFAIASSEFRDVDEEVLDRAWRIVEKSVEDWG